MNYVKKLIDNRLEKVNTSIQIYEENIQQTEIDLRDLWVKHNELVEEKEQLRQQKKQF